MRVVLAASKTAQVFLYIFGPGGTGKSIFSHVLTALLGQKRVVQTTLKALNTDQFESFNLIGKPLIMISDSEGYEGDLTILKQITGNDIIAGRAKYVQGAFEISRTGNVMVIANNPFFTKESGNAVLRRLLIFPSLNIIRDKTYLIEPGESAFRGPLTDELPGILAWVLGMSLEQAHLYLKNPKEWVPSLSEALENTFEQANPLYGWISKGLVHTGSSKDSELVGAVSDPKPHTLYSSYLSCCKRLGVRPLSPRTFPHSILHLMQSKGWADCQLIRRTDG